MGRIRPTLWPERNDFKKSGTERVKMTDENFKNPVIYVKWSGHWGSNEQPGLNRVIRAELESIIENVCFRTVQIDSNWCEAQFEARRKSIRKIFEPYMLYAIICTKHIIQYLRQIFYMITRIQWLRLEKLRLYNKCFCNLKSFFLILPDYNQYSVWWSLRH